MYITLETDYAIRMIHALAQAPGRMGAKTIAEQSCVTLRFSLKILRKLVGSGLVQSYKGAQGGYEIARPLDKISLNDILEAIEGPYTLSRCTQAGFACSNENRDDCPYRDIFVDLSRKMRDELQGVTIADMMRAGAKELPQAEPGETVGA